MESLILKIGNTYRKYYFNEGASTGLSLGRAFSNDIIIDDPYVGEAQLTISSSLDDNYDWSVAITDSTNPVFLNKTNIAEQVIGLRSGDRLTIGRTSIALYSEDHAVPATRVFSFSNWLHNHQLKPYIAVLSLLIMLASGFLEVYLASPSVPDWGVLSSTVFGFAVIAFVWASIWSFASRLLKGDYFFSSHMFFTSIFLTLLIYAVELGSYVDYMFSSLIAGIVFSWLAITLLGGLLIGLNLALVSYSSKVFRAGMLVSVCIVSAIASLTYVNFPEYTNRPYHSVTFKPAFVPRSASVSVDSYISNYDTMFQQLEIMKAETTADF